MKQATPFIILSRFLKALNYKAMDVKNKPDIYKKYNY